MEAMNVRLSSERMPETISDSMRASMVAISMARPRYAVPGILTAGIAARRWDGRATVP